MNYLIHGAGGFVGQALLRSLLQADSPDHIWAVDRDVERLSCIPTNSQLITTQLSAVIPRDETVDLIVCLAGATSVDAALADPELAIRENLEIAVDLGEWLRMRPNSRAIYMSSDEVLGESYEPLSEMAPVRPTQPYATSKAAAELILQNYRSVYGAQIAIVRSCNLVGVGQREPKLIPSALRHLESRSPVPIHGTGQQRREWMAVEDLCGALVHIAQSPSMTGIYQATSGISLSVLDVVGIIAGELNIAPQFNFVPDRLVQDRSYRMDPSRLLRSGWRPTVDPTEAVRQIARLA